MIDAGPDTVTWQACAEPPHSAWALVSCHPLANVALTWMSRLTVVRCSTFKVIGATELIETPGPVRFGLGVTATAVPSLSFERSTSTVTAADRRSDARPLRVTLSVAGGPLTTRPTGGMLL